MLAIGALLDPATGLSTSYAVVAYLDAGTGGMLLQLLLGGVAGVAVVAKLYWHRVKAAFGLGTDEQSVQQSDQNDPASKLRSE